MVLTVLPMFIAAWWWQKLCTVTLKSADKPNISQRSHFCFKWERLQGRKSILVTNVRFWQGRWDWKKAVSDISSPPRLHYSARYFITTFLSPKRKWWYFIKTSTHANRLIWSVYGLLQTNMCRTFVSITKYVPAILPIDTAFPTAAVIKVRARTHYRPLMKVRDVVYGLRLARQAARHGGWTPDLMTYGGRCAFFLYFCSQHGRTASRQMCGPLEKLHFLSQSLLSSVSLLSNEACLPSCLRECQGKQNYANSKHINITLRVAWRFPRWACAVP